MSEIWWRVFAIGLVIAIALELVGLRASFPVLLLASALLVLAGFVVISSVHNIRHRHRPDHRTGAGSPSGE